MSRFLMVLLGGFIFQVSACTGQNSSSDPVNEVLSTEAFAQKLQEMDQPQLLDVRRPDEFSRGHLDGAININVLDEPAFLTAIKSLNKEQAVMVYCQAGARSQKAASILEEAGFQLIYDLQGGYQAWSQKKQ